MKNVLFIHSSSELYGSDRSLLNIVKNIDKKKFGVYVILPCIGPLFDEMCKISDVTVQIYEVAVLRRKNLSVKGGIKYLSDYLKSVKYLKNYISEHKIDIVDTNTAVVFPGAVAARHMRKKSVWHIREIIKNQMENRVISFMMKCYADVIIANSKASGDALKVPNKMVKVVYNAVEDKTENELEKGFSTEKQGLFIVGMAGRINRWKGQKLFVDAAELVCQRFPNVLFQIAGEAYAGEEYLKNELQEYIDGNSLGEQVHLLGQVNEMSSFYRNIDIFVLPSIQPEPFGLVLIEAMEFGIPVVATRHGGPVEIINDKIDGYLVAYDNPIEMSERICELLENAELRMRIGENGKLKRKQQFTISVMVEKIETIFDEVMEG